MLEGVRIASKGIGSEGSLEEDTTKINEYACTCRELPGKKPLCRQVSENHLKALLSYGLNITLKTPIYATSKGLLHLLLDDSYSILSYDFMYNRHRQADHPDKRRERRQYK